jgi:hypothetical protein
MFVRDAEKETQGERQTDRKKINAVHHSIRQSPRTDAPTGL